MNEKLISIACLTGFFGDAGLQLLTKFVNISGPTGWGLKNYFKLHGSFESLCIAAGMMTVFYIFYLYVLRLPPKLSYLAIYGIILDLLFRKFRLFASLDGYYKALNYFWSGFWGAVPLILPLLISNILRKG